MSERVECDHCGRVRGNEADFDCESCNVHVPECPACAVLCWRSMGGDCADPDWMRRCLAAVQLAEAAEAERDRMRTAITAFCEEVEREEGRRGRGPGGQHVTPCGDFVSATPSIMRSLGIWVRQFRAIDAFRSGQPATSEAEQIAAWAAGLDDDYDYTPAQIAAGIRSGAWRKGQG